MEIGERVFASVWEVGLCVGGGGSCEGQVPIMCRNVPVSENA